MFACGELDICSLCEQSIYARVARIRYVAFGNECRLRLFLLAPQGISSAKRISSDASAAHIDVESSCETHDGLDMPCSGKHINRINYVGAIAQIA